MIDQLLSKKKYIGKGATSTTYQVINCFTNKGSLCLKVLNDDFYRLSEKNQKVKSLWTEEEDLNDDDADEPKIDMKKVQQLYKEFEVLYNLDHPNIIQVYGFYYGDENHSPAILLEYCKYSLDKIITGLEDIDLVGIIFEICTAMKYLHQNKIIHRDLKMTNILVNIKKHVKICDFGVSKVVDIATLTSMSQKVGTIAFMAPELFREDGKYNEKVDVYSFGVVMYFILTKGTSPPFKGTGCYESLKLPSSINKLSRSIIKSCFSNSPEERPSFRRILKYIVNNNFMLIDGIEDEIPKLMEHLNLE